MTAVRETGSARVAELLRSEPALDDLHRARLERRFLETATARVPARSPSATPARRGGRAAVAVATVVIAAAAGYALAIAGGSLGGTGPSFTIERASGGPIAVGTRFDVAPGDEVRATVFDLDLVASAGSSVRFSGVSRDDVRLSLDRGLVSFAFHPEERGREHVTIETPAARVEIVGTELSVRVDGEGTEVTVTEGRVRVVPASGEEVFVSAGEHVLVAAPPMAVVVPRDVVPVEAAAPAEDAPTSAALEIDGPTAGSTEPIAEPGVETAASGAPVGPVTADASEEAPAELSVEDRIARAEERLDRDRAAARRELVEIARDASVARAARAEAYLFLADSFSSAHENERALEALGHAARLGRGTPHAAAAVYERARLLERMGRTSEAREAYERYLADHPDGANAPSVTSRLAALPGGP